LIRIMTYNVHGCRGRDRQWSPQRIADVIASAEPDIVALQELDVGRARSGGVDQAELIAKALGMRAQFHPAMRVMEEQYGDAVLTACPSRLIKAGPLPGLPQLRAFEPRGAVWTTVTVGHHQVQVVNTHLSLLARERRKQLDCLLSRDWLGHPDCRDPIFLVGDFNMQPRSRNYRQVTARLRDAHRSRNRHYQATFPSRFPTLRIDYAFVSAGIHVRAVETIRTPLARIASDHLPLVVDFDVEPAFSHLEMAAK
jgi:endonuclease/exonuclease/phosphatase family metal-dependent hydrolase